MWREIYRFFIVLEKYRWWILGTAFGIGFVGGIYVYGWIYQVGFSALIYTVQLFVADVKTFGDLSIVSSLEDAPADAWKIYIPATFAQIFLFFGLVLLFFKSQVARLHHWLSIKRGDHTLVIGLGRNSRFFIDSELESKQPSNIVVVEKDPNNPYIKHYQDQAVSVIIDDTANRLERLNIAKCREIFISTGNDQENILISLKILKDAQKDMQKKLVIHIEDRTLRSLYVDEGLFRTDMMDVEPFSFYQQSARELFQEHPIVGDGDDLIQSTQPFGVVAVGKTPLAVEILFEAIKVAQLPNENKLHLYFIDQDAEAFERYIRYHMPYYEQLPNTVLHFIGLDKDQNSFYADTVWKNEILKHIILCHEESVDNVRIATQLKGFTYTNPREGFTTPKIHIATYHKSQIAEEVKRYNTEQTKGVYAFAEAKEICNRKNLLHSELNRLAKIVHRGYTLKAEGYKPEALLVSQKIICRTWESHALINDRKASFAQALHINTKLKTLGLTRVPSPIAVKALAAANREVLREALEPSFQTLGVKGKTLGEVFEELKANAFFPEQYQTIFEKLLRAEHNRWMAILISMGNRYDEKAKNYKGKDKERKLRKIHHLLKPLEAFTEESEKRYILNDIYAVFYIPEYLAQIGYAMVRNT